MAYNSFNNVYPINPLTPIQPVQPVQAIQPVQPVQSFQPMYQQAQQVGYGQQPVQYQQQQLPQNNTYNPTVNPVNGSGMNNGNSGNGNMGGYSNNSNMNMGQNDQGMNQNMSNDSQNMQSSQSHQIGHGISSTDIIWVNDEEEVEEYPIAPNTNGMFMSINQMKMFTKDGSTGLIRDFDLLESQESIDRVQQMQKIEKAQFPIIDGYATEIDPNAQKEEIINDLQEKMDEKFQNLEKKLSELSQFVGAENSNIKETPKRGRPSTKKN